VTGVTYVTSNGTGQPVGALTQVVFGSTSGPGDSDNFSYDPNTNRMNKYTFTVNGQSVVGNPNWNANGTLRELNITQDPFNPGNVQDCLYGYDDFVRLASTACKNGSTTVWSQTFGYDQFGNITKSGNGSWACAACYDQTTNRYNNILSGQITYDANGNLTNDTFHTYQWDATGHMIGVGGSYQSNQTFDALGNLAEQNIPSSSWTAQFLYDEKGKELGYAKAQSAGWTWVPLPGGATAIYAGGNLQNYWHADWLGSSRLGSTPNRTLFSDQAFAPFGEPYAVSGNTTQSFATMLQNLVPDLFETPVREYHPMQGRWISPDPMRGTGNKYVYADNNPLSKVDVYGMYSVEIEGMEVGSVDDTLDFAAYQIEESHPPQSQQTGGQTTTAPSGGNSSTSTQTASSQQQDGANLAQGQAEPAKQAQDQNSADQPGQGQPSQPGQPQQPDPAKQPSWDKSKPLPDDPSKLGPDWRKNPDYKNPNGDEYINDKTGEKIEWNKGRPGPWGPNSDRGSDGWHYTPPGGERGRQLDPGQVIKSGMIVTMGIIIDFIVETAPEWGPVVIAF
jgi:RHS repeat-associated protein